MCHQESICSTINSLKVLHDHVMKHCGPIGMLQANIFIIFIFPFNFNILIIHHHLICRTFRYFLSSSKLSSLDHHHLLPSLSFLIFIYLFSEFIITFNLNLVLSVLLPSLWIFIVIMESIKTIDDNENNKMIMRN